MNWDPGSANLAVGSFMPWFEWAVERTAGPVLELGGGYFSSPLVSGLWNAGRQAYTYEYDPEWAAELRQRFKQPIRQDFNDLPSLEWDVVLIDCEGWNRWLFFDELRPRTRVFVVHDSQDPWIPADVFTSFKYHTNREEDPRTTLVSDVLDVRRAP